MSNVWETLSQQVKDRIATTADKLLRPASQFIQKNPTPMDVISRQFAPQIQQVSSFIRKNPAPVNFAMKLAPQPTGNIGQRIMNQPVLPFVPQSTIPNIGKASQFIGNQLQKVNLPTPALSDKSMVTGGNTFANMAKGSFPFLQIPEQINTFAQSYGRTLSEPQKHPLETAFNLLPVAGFTKTKAIQSELRKVVAKAKTPEEAATIYRQFSDNILSRPVKENLLGLRASLAQELKNLAGSETGYYKNDYKAYMTLKNDETIGTIVSTIMDKIEEVSDVLKKLPAKEATHLNPYTGIGRDVARKGYTADEIFKMKPTQGTNAILNQEYIKEKAPTAVTSKVNILDYLRSPENVLKKIGLYDESKALRSGYEAYQKELPYELGKISKWMKRVSPESNERIFRALDGENMSLVGEESKVYAEVKKYLSDWATKLKLPTHKRVSDYITHIFDTGTIQQEFDEDLAKLIDQKISGSVYDPFLQKRTGQRLDYIKDTWLALQAYTKRAVRKYNIDPALEMLSKKEPTLELSQWNYVKKLVDRVNMVPTETDNLIDNLVKSIPVIGYKFGQRPTASLTRTGRELIYRGGLGLNVGSALRNLSQGANTYSELGERWTLTGYAKLFRNWGTDELERVGVLRDSFVQDKKISVYKETLAKMDKVLFSLFETAEKINRGSAYWGAKAKALHDGMSEEKAIDFAKSIVRKTQFQFGSIDTPVALSSDIVKTLTQFQSYNLKQLEYLIEKIGKKEFGGLIRYIGSMLVIGKVLKDSFGMKLDVLPTGFSLTPSVQLLKSGGALLFGDEEAKTQAKKDLVKTGAILFPAGVQIKKTLQGMQAYNRGASETPSGNIRFPVEKNTSNFIKSGLFGQYSTPEAQRYFNSNTRPLSEKQSELVRQNGKSAYNDILLSREESTKDTLSKKSVEETGKPIRDGAKVFYKSNGEIHSVDLSFVPDRPQLTGDLAIDKQLISRYKSALTTQRNKVIDAVAIGVVTVDQVRDIVGSLETTRARLSTKSAPKPKAPSFKKPSLKKISMKKVKWGKFKKYKVPKLKTIARMKYPKLKYTA